MKTIGKSKPSRWPWFPATKQDLEELKQLIMVTAQQLIDAGTALSTAADGLSVKVDKLVDAAEAAIVALQNVSLPPGADVALANLQKATTAAAVEGDKVDAEVVKLDAVLPAPAPPAP